MAVNDHEIEELTHPNDVAALLDALLATGASLHLSPESGVQLTLQPLEYQRQQTLLLRLPLQQSLPPWLLQDTVHAHATLAGVLVDFELGARRLVTVDGQQVLGVTPPTRVRRHQRRQSFRVAPASTLLPRVHLRWNGRPLSLATADISTGGLALRWPEAEGTPPSHTEIKDVVLELSREQRLAIELRAGHLRPGKGGEHIIGCAFSRLPPQGERQLQQFLNDLQRQWRSRS